MTKNSFELIELLSVVFFCNCVTIQVHPSDYCDVYSMAAQQTTSILLQYRFHDRLFQEAYYCNMHTQQCIVQSLSKLSWTTARTLFTICKAHVNAWLVSIRKLNSYNKNIHHCEIPISIRFLLLCPENTQHKDVNTITIEIP